MVTKFLYIFAIIGFIFTLNSFGQKQKKTSLRPEIEDEVIIGLHKKQAKSNALRQNSSNSKSSRLAQSPCHYPMCGGKTSVVNKPKSNKSEVSIESLERKSATPFDKGTLPPAIKLRKKTLLFDEADALFGKKHEFQNQAVFEPNDEPLWANVRKTSSKTNQRKISIRKKN
jgi:hypothetical protein